MIGWKQILLQLRSSGLSYGQISIATSVPCGTLRALVNRGGQPVHANGEKIVAYWCRRMNLSRDELPKVDAIASTIVIEADNSTAEISTLRECG